MKSLQHQQAREANRNGGMSLCRSLPAVARLPLLRPLLARPLTGSVAAAAGKDEQQAKPAKQQKQQKEQQQPKAQSGKGKKDKEEEGPYSATVRLPVTSFNLRANSVVREPEIQAFWSEQRVYESLVASDAAGESFTLHDGPPYANGDLHIGHALNKILKDFINRYQLLRGKRARFVPGWDTHGLPIELKVLQSLPEAERKSLGVLELRQKAREFALKTLDAQRTQFKRYGVWADWDTPYVTLEPRYEAAQLRVFGKMFLNGHIYRGRKPVHWSPSSRTALAEAELEYPEGHKSRSIYVAMPLTQAGPKVAADHAPALEGAGFAIWTTTPWTIPANLAVAVNGHLDYCVVQAQGSGSEAWQLKRLVVAKELVPRLAEKFGVQFEVVATLKGEELEGCRYRHPLYPRDSPVVVGGDYITTETGTGLVHTAPGHGQEDYLVGQRYGLELLSPVDDAGRFTEEAGDRFKGLNVQAEGNTAVVTALSEAGVLLKEEQYEHKYPYDWRTKKPTIFRATSQWFASVEGFRGAALEAIRNVQWVPQAGFNRITAMTESRSDWCISRQRKWGVPIPVFYNTESGEPLLTEATLSHITALVAQHGTDCWWTLAVEELLPQELRHLAPTLRKGEDTMDVWFDSGSSWAGVLQEGAQQGLRYPADLYLEGSDQHRGWFQSSLLTSVAATGGAPYRQVLTHGFVLDEKGLKMSKSLGNVVDPRGVIEGGKDQKKEPPYGADVLRMWVASVDYTSDVMIGQGILKQTAEVYKKVRGTLRFLLGSLSDYDPQKHAVPYDQLPALDRYMLYRLGTLMNEVTTAYETFQFFRIFQAIQRFVVVDVSSFYLDVAKDRLYIRSTDSGARRSCQTVLDALLRGLLSGLAPLVPHMAEDAWVALPYARPATSVFQAGWAATPAEWTSMPQEEVALWGAVLQLRDNVNGVLDLARREKAVGSSLDARLTLHVSEAGLRERLRKMDGAKNGVDELRYLFLVSQTEIVDDAAVALQAPFHETSTPTAPVLSGASSSSDGASSSSGGGGGSSIGSSAVAATGTVAVGIAKAQGHKCARCWNYSEHVGSPAAVESGHPELCERCTPIVQELGFTLPQPKAPAAKQPAAV